MDLYNGRIMTYYNDLPEVQPQPDGKTWKLFGVWLVNVFQLGELEIPDGFIFDFASIPRVARWWRSPATGKHRLAAIVHDYLYNTKQCKRKKADEIFYWCLQQDGVPKWEAYLMYLAVRSGGWVAWNNNNKDQ